jgi:hypothetical protein
MAGEHWPVRRAELIHYKNVEDVLTHSCFRRPRAYDQVEKVGAFGLPPAVPRHPAAPSSVRRLP